MVGVQKIPRVPLDIFFLWWCYFCLNSKKQETVAQSSTKAEYIIVASAANQGLWLRKILLNLKINIKDSTTLWVENKSTITMAHNPIYHGRTKHIIIKFHVIKDVVKNGERSIEYCCTTDQLADLFTKGFNRKRFEELRSKIGICNTNLQEVCQNEDLCY